MQFACAIVMIDADGSTDPMEIPRFVESLRTVVDPAGLDVVVLGAHGRRADGVIDADAR